MLTGKGQKPTYILASHLLGFCFHYGLMSDKATPKQGA